VIKAADGRHRSVDDRKACSVKLPELLEQLRTLDEHSRLEAKTASQLGESALTTICAFANEPGLGGGTLVLGVERVNEDAAFPDYFVRGIPDPDKVQADLVSQCRSVFNVPLSVTITPERTDGKIVLVVEVPEATPAVKPIHFIKRPLPGGAYRRLGSADVKCTDDDLALLFQQRGTLPFDATLVEDSGRDDIDPDAVAVYRTMRARGNPAAEELRLGDIDLLRALRCMDTAGSGITVAGMVLFGRALAQRRLFPMLRLDYVRVPGRDWVPETGERFTTTLDMRGPLLLLLGRAQAAVLDDLPHAFHLPDDTMQRRDEPGLPLRVIREAVVNAVMHRNYRAQRPTQIVRYSNRLEIRNAGYSLKAPERLGEPGSEARNPTIAAVLHELNFAETKGTGIRTMQTEMRRAGLSPPTFVSDRGPDSFTATFLFHHFLDEADAAWLGCFRDLDLNDDLLKTLVFVREQGWINNAAYRDLTLAHPTDATRALRRLCDLNLLLPVGNTLNRVYWPGPAMTAAVKLVAGPDTMHDSGETMHDSGETMHDSGETMHDNGETMHDNGETMHDSGTGAAEPGQAHPTLPTPVRTLLAGLGRRTDPAILRSVIRQLCAWRAHSVADLANLLGRSPTYTRSVMAALVTQGALEQTRPGQPRHPDQTYRAVEATTESMTANHSIQRSDSGSPCAPISDQLKDPARKRGRGQKTALSE